MADVFRIGVAIGMTDNATQVLQTLASRVLGLNLAVKDLEGGFNRVKMAAIGLAGVLASREIFRGLDAMATAGAKIVDQQAAMASKGMTHLQIARETAVAYQTIANVRGPDIASRLGAIRELQGIVGSGPRGDDFREINALLPNYLRVRSLLGEHGSNDLFRAIEQQGGARYLANGEFDQARFGKYLDAGLRTIQAAGGNITPRDMLNVMQMASTTAKGMDPDTFWNTMMTPMMEMGGHRAGTALTAFSRAFYGGIMPERNARELDRLGLYNNGAVRVLPHITREERAQLTKQGYTVGANGFVMVGSGALRGEAELNDPTRGVFPWINDQLLPRLKADFQKRFASRRGNTETWDAYVRDEMYKALPTETARRFVSLLTTQGTSVQRDQALRSEATGLKSYDINLQTYTTALDNLHKSWSSFMETLGVPAAQDGARLLNALGKGIDYMTGVLAAHPGAAKDLERIGIGLGVLTSVGGAAAIGLTVLRIAQIAGGLRALSGVMAGAEMASAVGTAGALAGGVGVAGSLLGVAAGITALGIAILALPPFMKWLADNGPGNTHPDSNAHGIAYNRPRPALIAPAPVDTRKPWWQQAKDAAVTAWNEDPVQRGNSRGLQQMHQSSDGQPIVIEMHMDGKKIATAAIPHLRAIAASDTRKHRRSTSADADWREHLQMPNAQGGVN